MSNGNDIHFLSVSDKLCRLSERRCCWSDIGNAKKKNTVKLFGNNDLTKYLEIMETAKDKKRMTASEKRFAKEIETLVKMSLNDLMKVEKTRMPVGV